MAHVFAPWTDEQVADLNEWQHLGFVHEFTCGNEHEGDRVLAATNEGWNCPTCDYTQNWCHDFMLDSKKVKKDFYSTPFGKIVKKHQKK